MSVQVCRFCHQYETDEMVKYGRRHYAHYECFLKSGKPLTTLKPWQLGQFPYLLLKQYGKIDEVHRLIEG